jgi:hypothetical protein
MKKFTHMRLRKAHIGNSVNILNGDVYVYPCGQVHTGFYIFMLDSSQPTDEEINDWWYSWLADKEKKELDSFIDEDKPEKQVDEQQSKKGVRL